jgi:hypothetical protein
MIIGRCQLQVSTNHVVSAISALEHHSKFLKKTLETQRYFVFFSMTIIPILGVTFLFMVLKLEFNSIPPNRNRPLLIQVGVIGVCFVSAMINVAPLAFSGRLYCRWNRSLLEDAITSGIYCRQATIPKDMAFSAWPVLQKLSRSELPMLHYGAGLGEVYWKFTAEMITVTKSLNLLYLAAAQSFPGAPSWVPDWSAHGTHPWESHFPFTRKVSLSGRVLISFFLGPSTLFRKTERFAYAEVDEMCRVLTVRARRICNITMIALFHQTSETLRDEESSVHDENLRLLQVLSRTYWPMENTKPFPYNLLQQLEIDPKPFLGGQSRRVSQWAKFCHKHSKEDPAQVMARLKRRNLSKYESILSTQIMLCNALASKKKILYRATSSVYTGLKLSGIGNPDVRVGDYVIRISGVPQPLVVRDRHQEEREVEIVSPTYFVYSYRVRWRQWRGDYRYGFLWRGFETDVQLEQQFVKYRIH